MVFLWENMFAQKSLDTCLQGLGPAIQEKRPKYQIMISEKYVMSISANAPVCKDWDQQEKQPQFPHRKSVRSDPNLSPSSFYDLFTNLDFHSSLIADWSDHLCLFTTKIISHQHFLDQCTIHDFAGLPFDDNNWNYLETSKKKWLCRPQNFKAGFHFSNLNLKLKTSYMASHFKCERMIEW